MGIAQTLSAQSDASRKALLILLTLPPVLPPRLIIIARTVLAFDSIFTGVDRPAYMARLGSVIQPIPLGAFKPRLCRMMRFTEVRAAIRLMWDGMRKPNFMVLV